VPPADFQLDLERRARLGLDEAVLCQGKTAGQIAGILDRLSRRRGPALLTRLAPSSLAALPPRLRDRLDYDPLSRTAVLGRLPRLRAGPRVAVVTGGTSDLGVAREAARALACHGVGVREFADLGVAGLWRLLRRLGSIRRHRVVIVVAGMEGALPSVVGGLVPGVVIAVPTSVGYGVARRGLAALRACLASCAPGVVVVNVDNGYGAACAALRVLRAGRGARA
jgi:hypothetical protein